MSKKAKYSRYGDYLTKLKKVYQQKEIKLYTDLVLSFAAIIGFAVFAIKPTVTTIFRIYKELEDQREVNQRLDTKLESLRQARKIYKKIESDLYLLEEALPKNPNPDLFTAQLEQLARQNNCEISALSIGSVNLKGEVEIKDEQNAKKASQESRLSIKGSLQVFGNYRDLVSFFNDLFNFRRINDVSSISISKASSAYELQAKVNFVTYYLPEVQ